MLNEFNFKFHVYTIIILGQYLSKLKLTSFDTYF